MTSTVLRPKLQQCSISYTYWFYRERYSTVGVCYLPYSEHNIRRVYPSQDFINYVQALVQVRWVHNVGINVFHCCTPFTACSSDGSSTTGQQHGFEVFVVFVVTPKSLLKQLMRRRLYLTFKCMYDKRNYKKPSHRRRNKLSS